MQHAFLKKCSSKASPDCKCGICSGHLAYCKKCECGEAELLSFCPGFALNDNARDAIQNGQIIDFTRMRKIYGYQAVE